MTETNSIVHAEALHKSFLLKIYSPILNEKDFFWVTCPIRPPFFPSFLSTKPVGNLQQLETQRAAV